MTPVGSGSPRPSLGFILPATTQGELSPDAGSTQSSTGSAAELVELCRCAEATGADSLWAVDHLYWPHPIGEAFTTLAVAAVTTTRPTAGHLRPAAAPAIRPPPWPSRRPLSSSSPAGASSSVSAWASTSLSTCGPASTTTGAAGSWTRASPGCGGPGPARSGARPTTCRSRHRRPVPLWFGGSSDAARRRAAAVGDGWVPLFLAPDEYGAALAALRRETAEAGRDPEAVQAGVVVFACVGDDDQAPVRGAQWLSELYRLPPKAFQRHLVAGSPETCASRPGPVRGRRGPPHPRDGGGVARRRAFRAAARRVRRRARARRWRECRHEQRHRRRDPRHRHDRHEPA